MNSCGSPEHLFSDIKSAIQHFRPLKIHFLVMLPDERLDSCNFTFIQLPFSATLVSPSTLISTETGSWNFRTNPVTLNLHIILLHMQDAQDSTTRAAVQFLLPIHLQSEDMFDCEHMRSQFNYSSPLPLLPDT